jgi:acyl-CoA synthetase (AMP-forming)/AMP-acid ligase II
MNVVLLECSRPRQSCPGDAPAVGASRPSEAATVADADNVALAFWSVAQARAESPAIVTADGVFDYRWLQSAAGTVRDYLSARPDFSPATCVALLLGNSPEYCAAFYGVLLAGGIVVPVPPRADARRWASIRRQCDVRWVLLRADLAGPLPLVPLEDAVRIRLPPPGEFVAPLAGGGSRDLRPKPAPATGDDLAMILFTSGSTGEPKGVMLSHANVLANTRSIASYLPMGGGQRALALMPFCHAFGNSVLQTHLLTGATLIVDGSPAFPASIVRALGDHQATSFSAVPEVYGSLLSLDCLAPRSLPCLRYMAVAGGALRPELAAEVARRIAPARFYVMYGQSEATARLAWLPPDELQRRPGSIGRGIPGVELRVAGRDGRPALPGEAGRLLARGPNVMRGYWRDPEATAAVLRDGWLDTGDLAVIDREGFFYLRGRSNLLFKIQGHRVHPREVEEAVARHFAGTEAVAVPYQNRGTTRLALFVRRQSGRPPTIAQVHRWCVQELPRHLVPAYIEVVDHFPLNPAMKIDLAALAGRAARSRRREAGGGRPAQAAPFQGAPPIKVG